MGKRDEKILEFQYSIEALEEEVQYLQDALIEQNREVGTLREEIDRYKESADQLTEELEESHFRIVELITEIDRLTLAYEPYEPMNVPKAKHFGTLSFDFWPLRDWFRLSQDRWHPGRAFQLCMGPVRFDWQEC